MRLVKKNISREIYIILVFSFETITNESLELGFSNFV